VRGGPLNGVGLEDTRRPAACRSPGALTPPRSPRPPWLSRAFIWLRREEEEEEGEEEGKRQMRTEMGT